MTTVGSANRVGWFMEPNCQSCHTGTATHNNGQIRYTSVFEASGAVRVAVDQTFATTPNAPAPGLDLYRFSVGHGGLQCTACHGSTHAIFATSHPNDNISSREVQGHAGTVAECTACHTTMPNTINGGPHGMHPTGQGWVTGHHDYIQRVGLAQCQTCHGTDSRGTVLSRAQGDRTVSAFGTQTYFRGAIIGCYTCHNGPSNSEQNPSAAPTVSNVAATTGAGQPVNLTLPASGAANLTLRIISQAAHGSVGLVNRVATYYPESGFVGQDTFTFAAYDGAKNSTLATGTITVGGTPPPISPVITTQPISQTVEAGGTVTFSVAATGTAPLAYQWQKDTVNLPGATSDTLTLASVTSADAGSYRVVVGNAASSVTSADAVLAVSAATLNIALTSPVDGAIYPERARITLSAAVSPIGRVARVQFFDGTSLLGTDTSAPFSMVARRLGSGSHVFTARATSTTGAVVTSAPVQITVTSRWGSYADRD